MFSDLNEAISKRDRFALERVYADEFQFVHTTGGVVDKTAQINNILANDRPSTAPVGTPTFEGQASEMQIERHAVTDPWVNLERTILSNLSKE